VGSTTDERAVAIITAYCLSSAHTETEAPGPDVAGQALFEIVDELIDGLLEAETDEELTEAKQEFYSTLTKVASWVDVLLDYVDEDEDKFQLISNIAREVYGEAHDDAE
jgi:hypothetical protein